MAIFNDELHPAPSVSDDVSPADSSMRRSPLWYLREATRIARFDHDAITRTSQDPRALLYGACIMAIAVVGQQLSGAVPFGLRQPPPPTLPVAVVAIVAIPVQLAVSAINIAVTHGAARLLFSATGHYRALLRVLWLGSVVQWLVVVPVIGQYVAGVWLLLITIVTFEEIDGIERLQALMLVFALGFLMFVGAALLT
jgi:hypothetical protein